MNRKNWFALVVLSTISLHAQIENDIEQVTLHGKFIKTEYRNAIENIKVISQDEIAKSPAQSIDELLQHFTGMDIRRRGAQGVQSDISIRGGSFEQVLILINGIRMNDAQTGHNSLHIPIDLASVERIELIKGPAARRFGFSAYTGAINIITKTSAQEQARIGVEVGDYKTYSIGLTSTFGSDKLQHLLQVNRGASDGYRHNTDYQIQNVFYQNQYKINNGKLGFQAGFSEKEFGANGFYASPKATEQYEETQASIVGVTYEQRLNNWDVNANIYWRRGQDFYLYDRHKPEIYRNMHVGNNVGGEVNASYHSKLGITGLGVEVRKEFLESNNLGKRDRFGTQVFFEHHFSAFQDKLKISPGVSWAKYDIGGDYFYPGLDVGYQINTNHQFYGNIGKVHRIPSFTDLYYVSKTEEGNPNLQAEKALSAEVGYRYQRENFTFKTSIFTRNTDNAIDWIKETENSVWKAQNLAKVDTQGAEVEVEKAFPTFFNSRFNVSYTYLDTKLDMGNLISKSVAENLRHQFIAKADVELFKNFTQQLSYRYLERVTTGSYHLLDAKWKYQYRNFDWSLSINNLTNTKYTEAFGVPMPGRWFHVGIGYTIR